MALAQRRSQGTSKRDRHRRKEDACNRNHYPICSTGIGKQKTNLIFQSQESHIKKVTEDFCDWVRSLGGENNIDPVTLGSLFASGHETKPALSVPIHVVDYTNIPSELRTAVSVGKMYDDEKDEDSEGNQTSRLVRFRLMDKKENILTNNTAASSKSPLTDPKRNHVADLVHGTCQKNCGRI
jgi:hypothetical protein